MARLNIRTLPDTVHARLRARAAQSGRSMATEARAILTEACLGPRERISAGPLQELVNELYKGAKPTGVVEDLIAERRAIR